MDVKSNALKVKEFTQESTNAETNVLRKMTKEEVLFLVTMVCEECMELLEGSGIVDTRGTLFACANRAKLPTVTYDKHENNVIAEQADAMVDIMYFCYNTAAKAGMDLDQIFSLVHTANMAKRFPDGNFHRDANGKVIKPDGWMPPNVLSLVSEWQEKGGSWSKQ